MPAARHAVAALSRPYGLDQFAVQTVVSELVGNAVVHAYVGRDPGPIVVVARVVRSLFVVTVADLGVGMKPRLDSPGLGIGIPLAGKLTHDLRIEAGDSGTTISASFELEPGGAVAKRGLGAVIDREIVAARCLLEDAAPRRSSAPDASVA